LTNTLGPLWLEKEIKENDENLNIENK